MHLFYAEAFATQIQKKIRKKSAISAQSAGEQISYFLAPNSGAKSTEMALMQKRLPVGGGPSSKM
jgi:hypothetical protein